MSSPPFIWPSALDGRSLGIKLIVVGVLAMLMTLPALFVYSLIEDRTVRAGQVATDISRSVGGAQLFLGPVLVIPQVTPATVDDKHNPVSAKDAGLTVIFPVTADVVADVKTEIRHRSLFKVPVYRAKLQLASTFDLTGADADTPKGTVLDWTRAQFVVGASDARGALADPTLDIAGASVAMAPVQGINADGRQPNGERVSMKVFGTGASSNVTPGAKFSVSANLAFSGARRLALLAYGKSTNLAIHADWPNPSFDGDFLPASSKITDHSFDANWAVPFAARGMSASGDVSLLSQLQDTQMGVTFIVLADPYQSVTRSVKYALLFLVLVFLTYFIFEVMSGKRVHPAQYILVGVAQIVFYLLLLAFAERIGFDAGFLIAALATVGLISAYASWVFGKVSYGLRAFVVFGLLYGLIYTLLRLEDEALLVGSVAAFLTIAAVMYVTRGIDWYGATKSKLPPPPPAV
jgi:inner membrane protein